MTPATRVRVLIPPWAGCLATVIRANRGWVTIQFDGGEEPVGLFRRGWLEEMAQDGEQERNSPHIAPETIPASRKT